MKKTAHSLLSLTSPAERRQRGRFSRYIAVAVAAFVLMAGLFFTACGPSAPDKKTPAADKAAAKADEILETSIRNVTKQTIAYTIRPVFSNGGPVNMSIEPGAISRFTDGAARDIEFKIGERDVTYRLDQGKAYAFRYDENDEVELFDGSHGRSDAPDLAPFVPTPMVVVEKMLELADVNSSDIVYDIGCGDGRIVITSAKKYGARGVGVDIVPQRIKECLAGAKEAGVERLVEFKLQDAMTLDISPATVVTLYLLPESNELVRPMLERQLKPGAFIVTHNYTMPGWETRELRSVSIKDEKGQDHSIFIYRR